MSVDVIITNYQYARFLKQSAASVLGQQVPDLRLLIIDNASTDGSQGVAREIAAADPRVSLILNEENQGYHHSFNRAIDWASADYMVILDADDLLSEGALAAGTAFLDKHPGASMLYGVEGRLADGYLDPGRGSPLLPRWIVTSGADYIRQTCADSFCDIGAPAVIRRTSAQKAAGHFRKSLERTCDFEMYLRFALQGDIARTTEVLGIRRMHPAQLSTQYLSSPAADLKEHELAFASFFEHEGAAVPRARELEALSRKKIGEYAYWCAVWQTVFRRPGARETFAMAVTNRGGSVAPPLSFLFKRRWLRSLWRIVLRKIFKPVPLKRPSDSRGRAAPSILAGAS